MTRLAVLVVVVVKMLVRVGKTVALVVMVTIKEVVVLVKTKIAVITIPKILSIRYNNL